jgi:hypothetical protein
VVPVITIINKARNRSRVRHEKHTQSPVSAERRVRHGAWCSNKE